jgi:hypothetical protein
MYAGVPITAPATVSVDDDVLVGVAAREYRRGFGVTAAAPGTA